MSCTFVPPYLLQREGRHPSRSASGRETLQVDDRLRPRRESAPGHMAAPRLPGAKTRVVHTANYTESLPGRSSGDGDPPSVIWRLTKLLTLRGRCGTCSTSSLAGGPLMAVAARCPSPSTMGVITTTRFGTVLSSSLVMGMGRSLIASPSRWMSWRTSSRTASRSSPSDWPSGSARRPK